jgi:hypothetical protein
MGMVGGDFGQRWPHIGAMFDTHTQRCSWFVTVGNGSTEDPFVEKCYSNTPALEITTSGWWTIGSSVDGNGLDYFVREGLGLLDMSHHIGTYRAGQITQVYGLPGNTLWMDSVDSNNVSPGWIVDELEFFCGPRRPRSAMLMAY